VKPISSQAINVAVDEAIIVGDNKSQKPTSKAARSE
jgi:hypothetical protein